MQFTFTHEQLQFRDMLRRFLQANSPTSAVRQLMETDQGFDTEVWQQCCQELALASLLIPENYGGAGFSFVEVSIVMEEMGRTLCCSPFFSSAVLSAEALLQSADEQQKQTWLPAIAAGSCRAALAVTENNGLWEQSGIELKSVKTSEGYELTGTKSFVIDGYTADLILVIARMGESSNANLALYAVTNETAGLKKTLLKTMDATRKLAKLEFDHVNAQLLGEVSAPQFKKLMDLAAIALASEMVGGAQILLDQSVAYAGSRMQFGRVIGSFQAIKHKCADMLLELELAKSAVYYAAAATEAANLPLLASMAKSAASDAYMHIAAEAIQIHGGIGFTWDQDTHLWFKRAKSSEVFFGDATYHREQVIKHWGDGI